MIEAGPSGFEPEFEAFSVLDERTSEASVISKLHYEPVERPMVNGVNIVCSDGRTSVTVRATIHWN
jgi:hypothetical protein